MLCACVCLSVCVTRCVCGCVYCHVSAGFSNELIVMTLLGDGASTTAAMGGAVGGVCAHEATAVAAALRASFASCCSAGSDMRDRQDGPICAPPCLRCRVKPTDAVFTTPNVPSTRPSAPAAAAAHEVVVVLVVVVVDECE